MSGGLGKKKTFIIKPQSAMNGEINVTPLVDVVLVLLIIFMTVTPIIERDIKVVLPSTEKVEDSKEVPIEQLVEFVTFVMTLEPGDIIATGTPEGIGPITAGDTVTIKVEGVGELTNPVQSE